MGNVQKLMNAGIIAPNATLNPADQALINSLSDAEVSALISIHSKLTPDFKQRNLGTQPSMGIVF